VSEAGSGDTPGAIRDLAFSFDRMSYPIMEISALAAGSALSRAEDLHKTFDLALGFVALQQEACLALVRQGGAPSSVGPSGFDFREIDGLQVSRKRSLGVFVVAIVPPVTGQ
jgi:hypothetical protein